MDRVPPNRDVDERTFEQLALFIHHRAAGLRLSVQPHDFIELFGQNHQMLGRISGETLTRMVAHHLADAALVVAVRHDLELAADITRAESYVLEVMMRKPPHPIPRVKREALRASRQRKKP